MIGEYVKLKRVGNSYRGPCPFHQGTDPNFSVVPSKRLYNCFVCSESGDVFSSCRSSSGWIRRRGEAGRRQVRDRRSKRCATRRRAGSAGAALGSEREAAEFFRTQLWDERAGETARDYLESRARLARSRGPVRPRLRAARVAMRCARISTRSASTRDAHRRPGCSSLREDAARAAAALPRPADVPDLRYDRNTSSASAADCSARASRSISTRRNRRSIPKGSCSTGCTGRSRRSRPTGAS